MMNSIHSNEKITCVKCDIKLISPNDIRRKMINVEVIVIERR